MRVHPTYQKEDFKVKLSEERLKKQDYSLLDEVQNWEDWYKIEKIYVNQIEEDLSEEDYEREFTRKPININGVKWLPIYAEATKKTVISNFFYENLRSKVFAKLEPSAYKNDFLKNEKLNKWCIYCGLRTYDLSVELCPVCHRDLLYFTVNWDEEK